MNAPRLKNSNIQENQTLEIIQVILKTEKIFN